MSVKKEEDRREEVGREWIGKRRCGEEQVISRIYDCTTGAQLEIPILMFME